jgi:hypothetical protein
MRGLRHDPLAHRSIQASLAMPGGMCVLSAIETESQLTEKRIMHRLLAVIAFLLLPHAKPADGSAQ